MGNLQSVKQVRKISVSGSGILTSAHNIGREVTGQVHLVPCLSPVIIWVNTCGGPRHSYPLCCLSYAQQPWITLELPLVILGTLHTTSNYFRNPFCAADNDLHTAAKTLSTTCAASEDLGHLSY